MRFAFYDRLTRNRQAIYRASDRITELQIASGGDMREIGARIARGLAAADRAAIERDCQVLIDALSAQFAKLPPVVVRVFEKRPKRHDGELHGLYEPCNDPSRGPARISVWMRTAQRVKVVAPRSFVRVLLHEFCHHLDYEHFGLAETFHTEGFYKRESALLVHVMGPREAVSSV